MLGDTTNSFGDWLDEHSSYVVDIQGMEETEIGCSKFFAMKDLQELLTDLDSSYKELLKVQKNISFMKGIYLGVGTQAVILMTIILVGRL